MYRYTQVCIDTTVPPPISPFCPSPRLHACQECWRPSKKSKDGAVNESISMRSRNQDTDRAVHQTIFYLLLHMHRFCLYSGDERLNEFDLNKTYTELSVYLSISLSTHPESVYLSASLYLSSYPWSISLGGSSHLPVGPASSSSSSSAFLGTGGIVVEIL